MDSDQQINSLKSKLNTLARVHSHLEQLKQTKNKLELLRRQLAQKVEKEFTDYEQVRVQNEKALRNLFLLPDDELLEKEKQEYFEAVMAFRKVEKEMSLIDFEVSILQEKLQEENTLKNTLKDLLQAKESQITSPTPDQKDLQSRLDRQEAIIEALEAVNQKGQDGLVRLEEIHEALHQIELTKKTVKERTYQEKQINRELTIINQHLAQLQIDFTMMEAEWLAYYKLADSPEAHLPYWEQRLGLLRQFSGNFIAKLTGGLLQQKLYHRSKKEVIQLKYELKMLLKEHRFLIEEQKAVRKHMPKS
ncbi:MAG: hypothetical protein R2828_06940 [Saprospiraceae bacterium]